MAAVHNQSQQQLVSGDPSQSQQFTTGQYQQDPQTHAAYVAPQGYSHMPPTGVRETAPPGLTHLFGGLNLQNPRVGSNYAPINGSVPAAVPPNMDLSSMQRTYNGQYMLFPNGTMFGSMPQTAHFPQPRLPGHDQVGQLQYMPAGIYPGFVAGAPVVPGAVQGYAWPYSTNGEIMPDLTAPRRNSWSSAEDKSGSAAPMVDAGRQPEYYPAVAPHMDRPFMGYAYGTPSPQAVQPYVPLQMMKTANGYVLQDLEALTQQEPPIPRAVPAMWTNPSELTLAKCLENREGITNVYIRGFLPETTDEMLHAYASRFGKIDRCKAIVDLETGLCKGSVLYTFLFSRLVLTWI